MAQLQGNGKVRKRARQSPSEVLKRLLVLCVFILSALCGPQETTMGRRPTIQTTVTASLTKSSLGACNQMLPVKFASKCVCLCSVFVILKSVKKKSKIGKVESPT